MTETENEAKEAEPVLYRTTIHWAALLGPGMLFVMGGVSVRARPLAALIMIGLALVWGLLSIHNLRASEFAIGTSRLTIRVGFPFKRFYEFPFSQIAGADYHQPALGVILNFGKVMIMHTTGKTIVFRLVAKPNDFVERLRREVDRFRQEQEPNPTGG
jgi:uncharacterized membrane protein YdbT with pleckstrin-like domain